MPQPLSNSAHAGLLLQRKCACGSPTESLTGKCAQCSGNKRLQTKLAIGASNHPLEQEADRVADQVLAASAYSAVHGAQPHIQRFTGQASKGAGSVPPSVDRVLASSGKPLEPALRQDMEQRFGHDFSNVQVHSGAAAEQSARDVSAHAYTVGRDIVFGTGQFTPATQEGRRLIAHELTHVVQQGSMENGSNTLRRVSIKPGSSKQRKDDPTAAEAAKQIESVREWATTAALDTKVWAQLQMRIRDADFALQDYRHNMDSGSFTITPVLATTNTAGGPNPISAAAAAGAAAVLLASALLVTLAQRSGNNGQAAQKLANELRSLGEIVITMNPATGSKQQDERKEKPEPQPKTGPDLPPTLPDSKPQCKAPTGTSKDDPIEMRWFKQLGYYPPKVTLEEGIHDMAMPKELPGSGHDIGVEPPYFPVAGKKIKKIPNSNKRVTSADFRSHMALNGFNWDRCQDPPSQFQPHEADHVQDLMWSHTGAAEDNDVYANLWPLDKFVNQFAGPEQNQNQIVTFCEIRNSAEPLKRPIGDSRLVNRWFVIKP